MAMSNETVALSKANAAEFKTEQEQDAYERGFDRGYSCASWQNLPDVGETIWTDGDGKVKVTVDNAWDIVSSLAYMGESNDRSYSPFEFTAKEFNDAEESEALWEAFGSGIDDGIVANIKERSDAYGPITEPEADDEADDDEETEDE